MTALPILTVNTAHSRYVIDQEAGTFTRTRVHPDANSLDVDGAPVAYEDIASPLAVGEQLVITHSNGRWVRSTPIVSVEESK